MLYSKETLILEEVTTTLLSNEIRKRPNQEEQEGSIWRSQEGREQEEERKVQVHRRHATSVIEVTGKMIASTNKSG